MSIASVTIDNGRMLVNAPWRTLLEFNGVTDAEALWALDGNPVKNVVKERGTCRCVLRRPEGGSIDVYLKRYRPLPFKEKFKNIICFKPYGFDGLHEWDALCRFHELGLRTMTPLAAARLGDGRTCDLTLGITEYTRASELVRSLPRTTPRRKRLVKRLAEAVGKMHAAGIAHQDLYLVHFFVREQDNDAVYLIDLQRTIHQKHLAWRWRVKDLAQLLYSSRSHVGEDEIMSFWQTYTQLTGLNPDDRRLVEAVRGKAAAIIRRERKRRQRVNPGSPYLE